MCDYFITLVQLCHKILRFTQKSTLGQLKAAFNEGELNSFQLNLERWAMNIKEEVTLLMAEKIEEEAIKTSKFQNALWKRITKSDDEILQAKIDAHLQVLNFCSQFDHTVIWKQTRKAGTTTLFRDSPEYVAWKDPASSCISCSLVYTGKLGCGKSVVLANIVEDLHLHTDIPVAYFFCRHDVPKSLKTRTMIRSLIRQILAGIQDLTSVAEVLNQCAERDEFKKMTSLLECAFPPGVLQCFIIVDGFDDLEKSERTKMITELSKLYDRNIVTMGFVSPTVTPIPENSSEIQDFILEELENCLESQKLAVGDPTLILEIRDALFHGSQGNTEWDPSKSLNNIYITLASCGCLINIDEEELTARLVHPSLKQFLLESHEQTTKAPLSLTLDSAHRYMSDIILTYLNYNVFDRQLSRTVIPRINASAATSTILQSSISSTSVRHLAIKLLKGKSESGVDLGKTLVQARSLCHDHADQDFYFHSYAKSYWHFHFARMTEEHERTYELLKKLFTARKVDGSALDDDGLTPLMVASILGNVNAVRFYLIFNGVDVNSKSESGLTALHLALLHKQYHTFTTILQYSTRPVDLADDQGRTLLILAAEQGDTEIFETLAHHHIYPGFALSMPDLNCVNENGETALHIASRLGFFCIIVSLLTLEQVDINAKDASGNTPLHKAIQGEHEDIVEQFLVCDRVKINAVNKYKRSALSMAIFSCNEDIQARLLMCSRLEGESKDRLKQILRLESE
ncbi:uncharacterized protein N7484_009177 [Penicillium longicatenatum]|uniref:uncharacterized protein n=1 Tax=Penicillium longicatenatum TaxID=1561947 RepID=UPI0025473F70|nr:uncharacterized protein N7484_009177 [Penicillium longicatenatum]KAJ5635864.1 hypothetical protein N7484_009177 [Penicillium longicatenatum]